MLLGKIQTLRTELLTHLGANSLKIDKELTSAHDFLLPWFVYHNSKSYYLQRKSNWKELKVGYLGRTIRFQNIMDTSLWDNAVAEIKPIHMITFEVCSNFYLARIFLHSSVILIMLWWECSKMILIKEWKSPNLN